MMTREELLAFLTGESGPAEDPEPATFLDRLRASLVDTVGLDQIQPPKPLVHNILQADSLAWLQGQPGHGKSFVAIDLAGCVGTGQVWQGYPVEQGGVLYLAAEGVTGVRQRVRAWEHAMGEPMKGVSFLPTAVQASSDLEWSALLTIAHEQQPRLVVLDTQARISVSMEENSARDMGVLVHRLEQLRKATGACVLTVHHQGRSGDHMRGSTALVGAATTIIKAEKAEDEIKISCVKQKDQVEFDPLTLRLVQAEESAFVCLMDPVRHSRTLSAAEERVVSTMREHFETLFASPAALVDTTGIPRSSIYRVLSSLVRRGLLERGGTEQRAVFRLRGGGL